MVSKQVANLPRPTGQEGSIPSPSATCWRCEKSPTGSCLFADFCGALGALCILVALGFALVTLVTLWRIYSV